MAQRFDVQFKRLASSPGHSNWEWPGEKATKGYFGLSPSAFLNLAAGHIKSYCTVWGMHNTIDPHIFS